MAGVHVCMVYTQGTHALLTGIDSPCNVTENKQSSYVISDHRINASIIRRHTLQQALQVRTFGVSSLQFILSLDASLNQ